MPIILNGQVIETRGANKKYPELDNLDELLEKLKKKSITQLAKELGCPQNSLRSRLFKYCSKEQIDGIFKERRYHKRRPGRRKVKVT